MRLLFIVIEQPWPPRSGADLRNWQNIAAASELAETAVVFLTGLDAEPPAPPLSLALWRRLDPRPPDVIWHPPAPETPIDVALSPEVLSAIDRLLADFAPDVVVLGHTQLHALAERVLAHGARLVVDMHNVESHLYRQLVPPRIVLKYLSRRVMGFGCGPIKAVERRLLGQADQIWLCSKEDRERLRCLGEGRASLHVVPNGLPAGRLRVETPREAPPAVVDDRRPQLLFLGHLAYPPNIQAANFLCRHLAPLLPSLPGSPELVLAGRAPTSKLRARAIASGVTLLADPPKVEPLLGAADLMLVPLGGGGGTRLKVLEAWGAGLPLVATATAVEGLGARSGRDYLKATSARDYATAIERLLSDRELYAALSAGGLRSIEERFAPVRISAAMAAALEALAQR